MLFKVKAISPSAVAFIRPDEGANAGLIRTGDDLTA
jgi:hypothetical protein